MLREKADEMRLDPELPRKVRTRMRGRRGGTVFVAVLVMAGLVVGGLAGVNALRDREAAVVRPAQTSSSLPIFPQTPGQLNAIRRSVAVGERTEWLDPVSVAEQFLATELEWERSDIEMEEPKALPGGDLTISASNPEVLSRIGFDKPIWQELVLRRLPEGVYVITSASTAAVSLESPQPDDPFRPKAPIRFAGRLNPPATKLDVRTELDYSIGGIGGGPALSTAPHDGRFDFESDLGDLLFPGFPGLPEVTAGDPQGVVVQLFVYRAEDTVGLTSFRLTP